MPMRRRIFLLALLAVLGLTPSYAGSTPAASAQSIPFEFVDGFIVLQAQLNSPREHVNLILDSGAGASVLSLSSAHRLNLSLGRSQTVQGVGMRTQAYELNRISAEANGVKLGRIQLAVDLSNATQLCSMPIDGLVGIDFFANRVVEIDFATKTVRLLSPAALDSAGNRLSLKPMNGTFCIPIQVNGSKSRWARFDTGCNDALHWTVPRTKSKDVAPNLSIGFLTDATDLAPSTLQIAGHTLANIQTSLHAQPLFPGETGLVGTGVLSQFIVTTDLAHGQIFLRPANPSQM